MVGIVIVSHSHLLGKEVIKIALDLMYLSIDDLTFPLINSSGLHDESLGTDPERIAKQILKAVTDEGVLILCDLGSSVLNTKKAIKLLPLKIQEKVIIADAPLVEGSIIAVSSNNRKTTLMSVLEEVEEVKKFPKVTR